MKTIILILLAFAAAFSVPCNVETVNSVVISITCPDIPGQVLYFKKPSREEWIAFTTPRPADTIPDTSKTRKRK